MLNVIYTMVGIECSGLGGPPISVFSIVASGEPWHPSFRLLNPMGVRVVGI